MRVSDFHLWFTSSPRCPHVVLLTHPAVVRFICFVLLTLDQYLEIHKNYILLLPKTDA